MKVVINKCYGGFSLSEQAIRLLVDSGCPHIKRTPALEYYGREDWQDYRAKGPALFKAPMQGSDVLTYDRDGGRDCPALVAAVELLGEAANGQFAQLGVVEIPDGVEYVVEGYDGKEWVAEKHRTWS